MGETFSQCSRQCSRQCYGLYDQEKITNAREFRNGIGRGIGVVRDRRRTKKCKKYKKCKRRKKKRAGKRHKRNGSNLSTASAPARTHESYSSPAYFADLAPKNSKHTRKGSNCKHKRIFSTASEPAYSQSTHFATLASANSEHGGAVRKNNAPVIRCVAETKVNNTAKFNEPVSSDLSNNALYNPDLVACCQNIATFFAEAVASSNTSVDKKAAPTAEYIYGYMRMLFDILDLARECCVIADIYVRRLLSNAKGELRIHSGNWQKILVGACLLASKYVDDESVENADVSIVLTGCSLQFMNKLESKFLEILNWQLHVPLSEYIARYSKLAKKDQAGDWKIDFTVIRPHFTVAIRTPDRKQRTYQ